jgi:hypothetical protein
MKRNLGYSMREAEKEFFDSCDGTNVMYLIEVFERDGDDDVSRTDPHCATDPRWGELWLVDEDGMNSVVAHDWDFEYRETVGHDRAALIEMKARGER